MPPDFAAVLRTECLCLPASWCISHLLIFLILFQYFTTLPSRATDQTTKSTNFGMYAQQEDETTSPMTYRRVVARHDEAEENKAIL